jgi:hypothetical protein
VNLRGIDGETELRPSRKQRLQRAGRLDPCELMAETEVNSRSE